MPAADPLNQLIERAGTLYSLPSVAMEVVRQTSQPNVDTRAIKEAVESDPALTAKVLRVVNSSMFGLSGEVGNLTQALALLGVRPLKLLVLGFSLPDRMFAGLAGDQLRRYWTTALTRSVAARAIAKDWFGARVSDDDAFVAALLRDIGLLVLIQELGEPYLKFLTATADVNDSESQQSLEQETLGFDHVELTAALLRSWRLPVALADAVAGPPADVESDSLAEAVYLADLVTQLVVGRRLAALGELLDRGDAACSLSRPMVNTLVESLEGQVASLAEALRAPIDEDREYTQVLCNAHAQLALVAESAVAASLDDDQLGESLLAESRELQLAMRTFLRGDAPGVVRRERTEQPHAAGGSAAQVELNAAAERRLEQAIGKLADRCRAEHADLSIALLAVEGVTLEADNRPAVRRLEQAMEAAEAHLDAGRATELTLTPHLVVVLMPGVDRRSANAFCRRVAEALSVDEPTEARPDAVVHAGVASIAAVPNRFDPRRLTEGAKRCLLAAQTAAAGAVKSIEVY